MKTIKTILTISIAATSIASSASFTDNFDDNTNIATFAAGSESVSENIFTFTRTDAAGDAGADWLIGGTTRFSLDPADQQDTLKITSDAQVGNGDWAAFILFFDAGGAYLTEETLFAFSNTIGSSVANISTLASSANVTGAEEYFLRMRVQGDANSGFEFSQFAAVPEPSNYALIGGTLMGLAALFRRRLNN